MKSTVCAAWVDAGCWMAETGRFGTGHEHMGGYTMYICVFESGRVHRIYSNVKMEDEVGKLNGNMWNRCRFTVKYCAKLLPYYYQNFL